MVGTSCVQTPMPHARPLPSVDTYRQGAWQCVDNYHDPPKFWIQSSLESPKHQRMRCRRLPDPRPIPDNVREPISIRKK